MLNIFITSLAAFLSNLIFYMFIKNKIDNSIEKLKIAYSGVFKEKIDIYKELLKKNVDLKHKIEKYPLFGNDDYANEIQTDFNNYIHFYLINQPFLSDNILKNIKLLIRNLQECFDNFYLDNALRNRDIDHQKRIELINKYFKSLSDIKSNNPFDEVEQNIISEMKLDLGIKYYNL